MRKMAYYEFGSDVSIDEMVQQLSDNVCFLCGKPLPEKIVYWHGSNGVIAFHPKCAAKVGNNLVKDAKENDLL